MSGEGDSKEVETKNMGLEREERGGKQKSCTPFLKTSQDWQLISGPLNMDICFAVSKSSFVLIELSLAGQKFSCSSALYMFDNW